MLGACNAYVKVQSRVPSSDIAVNSYVFFVCLFVFLVLLFLVCLFYFYFVIILFCLFYLFLGFFVVVFLVCLLPGSFYVSYVFHCFFSCFSYFF